VYKNIVIILISVLVAGVVVLGLGRMWPQSDATEGNREIYRRIEQAKPHLALAAKLLSGPVYKAEGKDETPPLAELTEADIIEPMPDAVNPKAWQAIADADTPLTEVLAEHPGADPKVRAVALQTLGEINRLKGAYHAERAAIARREAGVAFGLVDDALRTILLGQRAGERERMLAREMLEGASNEEIVRIRDEAAAARDAANARLAEIAAAVDALSGQINSLTVRIDELAEQEAALRRDSRTSRSAVEGQRLLNDALEIKAQIDQLKNEREDKNRQVELARQDQRRVRADIESLEARVVVAESALAERRDQSQAKRADIQDAAQVVATAESGLMSALEQLAAASQQAGEANSTAIGHFSEALSNAEQALGETGGGEVALLAGKARSLALVAKTRMADLALQSRLNGLAEAADKAYEGAVPAEVRTKLTGLQARIPNPTEQDHTTINELRDAADLFERVAKSARHEDRADYYGQLADVYFLLHQMTGEDSDRTKGEDRLREAKSRRGELAVDDPLRRMRPAGPVARPPAGPPDDEPSAEPPPDDEPPAEPSAGPPSDDESPAEPPAGPPSDEPAVE